MGVYPSVCTIDAMRATKGGCFAAYPARLQHRELRIGAVAFGRCPDVCQTAGRSRLSRRVQKRPRYAPLRVVCTGQSEIGGAPDEQGEQHDPPFIPQTIEYALREAQTATAAALMEGHTQLIVELPMGRSRKHWYRMSPMDGELVRAESATLTMHFAEMFSGANIQIVLGYDSRLSYDVEWIQRLDVLDETVLNNAGQAAEYALDSFTDSTGCDSGGSEPDSHSARTPRILIVGALLLSQKGQLDALLAVTPPDTAVVLVNCFLEVPFSRARVSSSFRPVYVCRTMDKMAILFIGYGPEAEGWHIFTETSIFEFEWVGRRPSDWLPTSAGVESVASQRGARRQGINGYYRSVAPACESGFWPFMTISCTLLLPVPGHVLENSRSKSQSQKRPFGFF